MSSSFIHTGLKSPAIHSSTAHGALQQPVLCVYRELSEIGHVSSWRLIHLILRHAPYSTVNRTKIRSIGGQSPEELISEFHAEFARSSDVYGYGELEHFLSSTTITVSQGSVAAVHRSGS